ncbi:MAG: chromosome segregation protein SMC [Dehalococcoidia bacterium]|nr:chromosome segregation protein SMC [Dehalococcoidia bacterium]
MYLRRLDAQGFKAFADPQKFEFGPGLTVIVGPNGSGKSNVSDAIRWALGETSARQVRARKTEDVIFSGSEKRRQLGAAEVSISLDNSEGWMPIEFGEVTVTRRAFRSGENEYLINGQNVRLSDVQDLFRRAQVGQNSYAMMTQGVVDGVLAMRPSERRDLIEEAANVRRHRQQVTLSERRLVETRDNLGRVRMLIREVEPRIRALQRQTSRAEKYRDLAARLREAQLVHYEHELRAANDALAVARAGHDQHSEEFEATSRVSAEMTARFEQLNALTAERRSALETAQLSERALADEERQLAQSLALARQRLELLTSRQTDLQAEIARLEAEPAATSDSDDIDALAARVEEWRTTGVREQEALRSVDDAVRGKLRELNEAEARRARLEAEHAEADRRVQEAELRQRALAEERTQARVARVAALEELKVLGQRALALQGEAAAIEATADLARERRAASERALEEQLRGVVEARDTLRAAESRLAQHQERATLLARLAGAAGVSGEGARAIIEAGESEADGALKGVLGSIIGLLRVPDGLDVAIEAALAEQLAAVVVERETDALAAVEYLRISEAGTATVLALDAVPQQYPVNLFNERGVIGVASRLVRCDAPCRQLVDALLGRTIIVEDLSTAREMVRRGLGSVVTQDGVLLRPGGSYFGGKTGAAARQFSLRREIEELPAQVVALEREIETARTRLTTLEESTVAARDAVETARAGYDGMEQRRATHRDAAEAVRRRVGTLSGEMRLVRRALVEAGGDDEALRTAIEAREHATLELGALGDRLAGVRDRATSVTAERDVVAERSTAAIAQLAAAQGAHRTALAQQAEREAVRQRALEQLDGARQRLDTARREFEDLTHSLAEAEERANVAAAARKLAEEALDQTREALGAVLREERALQEQRGAAQARFFAAERVLVESDGALRQALAQLQRVNEQLRDDGFEADEHGLVRPSATAELPARDALPLKVPADDPDSEALSLLGAPTTDELLEVGAVTPVRGGTTVDLPALREEISSLRAEIRALGPVNVDALEELTEERTRFDFLSGQVADLEAAEQELRRAIVELRKLIGARFDETFTAVNKAFIEYFQRFFGGGVAELKLLADEDDDEPGVEISAQPPGKRISSLSVLSGGERSLTSVALLFALLSVNPAPVCVLDEVDAALDEANVGRFVETLRELTNRSQFIVISHNRRTIEAADALYGVSMGEDSTSRVLSLRLADLPAAS